MSEVIAPAIVATAVRYGIALELIETDYGQVAQQALSPNVNSQSGKARCRPNGHGLGDSFAAARLEIPPRKIKLSGTPFRCSRMLRAAFKVLVARL